MEIKEDELYQKIRTEYEPYFGTVVLDLDFRLGILRDIYSDAEDFYYDVEDSYGVRHLQSCVGRIIILKGVLPDDDYEYIQSTFTLNKDFLVKHKEQLQKVYCECGNPIDPSDRCRVCRDCLVRDLKKLFNYTEK